jgi:hypothetical protein
MKRSEKSLRFFLILNTNDNKNQALPALGYNIPFGGVKSGIF